MSEIAIKNILDKKLKKGYEVLVPYDFIDKRVDQAVAKLQKNYKQKGFRPGKVPTEVIKEKYETSIMAEESEKIINETSKKIVDDNGLKLALSPQVEVKTFEPKKDFEYTVSMELFPEVPEIELDKIKLTKKEAEVGKEQIEDAIKRIMAGHKNWQKKEKEYKAKNGDTVNIDYSGKISGEIFEGGTAQGHQLELGTNSFIDTFEKQLVGKKAGDEVLVKVRFPKEYQNKEYADKKAEFDVKVNFVLCASEVEVTDEFVKEKFGLESVVKLEEAAKEQIGSGYDVMSKNIFKKELFELLNKKFNFELPEGLIDEQFKRVWDQTEEELKTNPDRFKNDKEKEKEKDKQRKLSEKMVRSGIILSQVSQKNKVTVTQEDLMQEINKRAMQFPGQEQMVAEYYQKNPNAVQEIRGALMEDKVVDFIIENAAIDKKKVSIKDLEKEVSKLSD